MHCNNWDKCADVISRLSSRVRNEQTPSTVAENCNTIEKSFYQCESNVGRKACIEVSNDCSNPIRMCNTNVCGQLCNSSDLHRHPFTLSNIFDDKQKYIDFIVSNVLDQVVNHISLDSLHELSCYLPKKVEEILCNVDMDSDRLVRVLVTDALQSYSAVIGQVTDWYAFANSIKLLSPSAVIQDVDRVAEKKIPSKEKSSSKKKKKKARSKSNNRSVPSMINREHSSESIAFSKFVTHTEDDINHSEHHLLRHMAINQSSLSTDCGLTVHRKHKHRHDADSTCRPTTTSFDTSSSHSSLSETPIFSREWIQKYEQILTSTSSMVSNAESVNSVLPPDSHANPVEKEHSSQYALTDERRKPSIVESHRFLSSKSRKKLNLSSRANPIQLQTSLAPKEKNLSK